MKSIKYLEQLQEKEKLSDTELAKRIGISQPSVSNLKAGRRVMEDETCLAIALLLEVNPMEVIGAACIDRAEKHGQKSLWEVFMTRTQTAKNAGVAATLALIFVTNFLTPDTGNAATARVSEKADLLAINYANFNIFKML